MDPDSSTTNSRTRATASARARVAPQPQPPRPARRTPARAPTSMEDAAPTFRHGLPMRMTGWLGVRVGWVPRRLSRFAKLNGEVLSFHESERTLPLDEFDIVGAIVEFSANGVKKSFRVTAGRRTFHLHCGSFEEMQTWAQSLHFASMRSFGRFYSLGALIREGAYSKVYYAYDVEHPDDVFAVKVVKKKAYDIQALEWLNRERLVNTVLNHPTVVQAVDMFSTVDKDHIVFELMRGGTLADLLDRQKGNRLPESYARVVMRELLTALHYVHSKNIVHRDVRPDNILCSREIFPMAIALADFGYATFVSDSSVNRDVLTTMIGTPPYIAVDICRKIKYGPLADIWSAGVVLYEMLCGEAPFISRSNRVYEKIRKGRVSFTQPVWKTISPEAIGFIRQMLQIDPHKRISALAALQHSWLNPPRPTSVSSAPPPGSNFSHSASTVSASPLPATLSAVALADRNSPDSTSTSISSRRNPTNNLSRIPSSTNSSDGAERKDSHLSERQTSSLAHQQSVRSLQPASSTSSLSAVGQPRMVYTPSVRAIAEKGLQAVASDNPARMKRLLSSSVMNRQLSSALPYRRKLVVAARAFVAIFRMRALTKGVSATRQLSVMGPGGSVDFDDMIGRRRAAMEAAAASAAEGQDKRANDRAGAASRLGHGARDNAGRRGHVRQRSRDVAAHVSHIMEKLSADRVKMQETGAAQ